MVSLCVNEGLLYLQVGYRSGSIAVYDKSFDLALIVEVPEEDLEAHVVACLF